MGLGLAFLRDLIELKRRGLLRTGGRVVEIGDQQLADNLISAPELAEAYRLFGCSTPPKLATVGEHNFTEGAPSARPFWQALGFHHESTDIGGGTFQLDLNSGIVPSKLRGTFDLVINTGTTEHVANQAHAFRVIHDLACAGGIIYHELPAGGLIDHGFFAYQPRFFNAMAQQNDYELLIFKMVQSPPSSVPAYVHELNARHGGVMPAEVLDVTLRVAFRKRNDFAFSVPIDAPPEFVPKSQRTAMRRAHLAAGRLTRVISRVRRRLIQTHAG